MRWIEQNDSSQLGDALADVIDQPELARPVPAPVQPFVDLQRCFQSVGLVWAPPDPAPLHQWPDALPS